MTSEVRGGAEDKGILAGRESFLAETEVDMGGVSESVLLLSDVELNCNEELVGGTTSEYLLILF